MTAFHLFEIVQGLRGEGSISGRHFKQMRGAREEILDLQLPSILD